MGLGPFSEGSETSSQHWPRLWEDTEENGMVCCLPGITINVNIPYFMPSPTPGMRNEPKCLHLNCLYHLVGGIKKWVSNCKNCVFIIQIKWWGAGEGRVVVCCVLHWPKLLTYLSVFSPHQAYQVGTVLLDSHFTEEKTEAQRLSGLKSHREYSYRFTWGNVASELSLMFHARSQLGQK